MDVQSLIITVSGNILKHTQGYTENGLNRGEYESKGPGSTTFLEQ